MAVPSYNDVRVGLDRCNVVAFYPRGSNGRVTGVKVKKKALEQGHMASHVLERVCSVYTDFLGAANATVRKRTLTRAVSQEVPPKRQHMIQADTGPMQALGCKTAPGAPPQPQEGQAGSAHKVKAKLFIGAIGNSGPKGQLLSQPLEQST